MNYKEDKDKFYLSIEKNEWVNDSILKLCCEQKMMFAWFNGIGAISDPELGYYDIDKKEYIKKIFSGHFEIVSLVGNMTIKDDKPFIHSHITLTDENFRAFGGHLFDCKISAAGEFIIFKGNELIKRTYNDSVGLSLWNCNI